MPFLKSLEISGFRSYSTNNPQILQFKSPVTLLLGKNGSGKTTVLEVLRYSCSGQFPPNSAQGKTFLRDPFLDNVKSTIAYSELIFYGIQKKQVIAKRNAKLIRGKKESYQNMGQFITIQNKQNKYVNIEQKLAKFDKTIPFLLGSNKEVLENVILCHQEDQFWMFQNPIQLKRIFDSIFNSAHITKFIEISKKFTKIKDKNNISYKHEVKFSKIEWEQQQCQKKNLMIQIQKLLEVRKKKQELNELILSHPDYQKLNQIERQIGDINSKIEYNKNYLQQIEDQIQKLGIKYEDKIDEEIIKKQLKEKNNKRNLLKDKIEQIRHNQENLGILVLQDQINTILEKLKFNILQDKDFCKKDNLTQQQKQLTAGKELREEEFQQVNQEYKLIQKNKNELIQSYTNKLNKLQQQQENLINIERQRQAFQFQQKLKVQKNVKQELLNDETKNENEIELLQIDIEKLQNYLELLQNTSILKLQKEKEKYVQNICRDQNWIINDFEDIQKIRNKLNNQIEEEQIKYQNQKAESNYLIKIISEKQQETYVIKQQKTELTEFLKENKLFNENNQNVLQQFQKLKEEIKILENQVLCYNENLRYTQQVYNSSIKQSNCQVCLQEIKAENFEMMDLSQQQKRAIFKDKLQKIQKKIKKLKTEYDCQKKFKEKFLIFNDCLKKLSLIEVDITQAVNQKKQIDKNLSEIQKNQSIIQDKKEELKNIEIKFCEINQQKIKINSLNNQILDINKDYKQIQDEIKQYEQNLIQKQNLLRTFIKTKEMIQKSVSVNQNKCIALQEEILSLGFQINEKIDDPKDIEKQDFALQIQNTQSAINNQSNHFQKKLDNLEDKRIQIKVQISFYNDCIQKIDEYIQKNNKHNSLEEKKKYYQQLDEITNEVLELTRQNQYIELQNKIQINKDQNKELQNNLKECIEKKDILSKGLKQFEELKNQINDQKGQEKVYKTQIQQQLLVLREKTSNINEEGNIEFKHVKATALKKINEKITQDIKYMNKGLEKACMSMNNEQIEVINKYIANIWRQTYSSSDIQTIRIQTEQKKNNNQELQYKIFAIDKNARKMDFKSKSSTGQKMLASIVIRLALAELYSEQCGIFALDEPTTNLDEDNIILLANFLKRLVNMKQADENFQLIIITHDQKFLKQMQNLISSYYRVEKNKQGYSQLSEIKVQMNL